MRHIKLETVVNLFYLIYSYFKYIPRPRSRGSIVGIATGYGLDDHGVGSSSPGRVNNFLYSKSTRPALGSTQLPIQWVPTVKLPGREADHSPPASAEAKKMWIYTSTPPYARLHGVVLNLLNTGTTLPLPRPNDKEMLPIGSHWEDADIT
jgi:hypothetical protein